MEWIAEFNDRSDIHMAMSVYMSYALYIIHITYKTLYMTIVILDCIAYLQNMYKSKEMKMHIFLAPSYYSIIEVFIYCYTASNKYNSTTMNQ